MFHWENGGMKYLTCVSVRKATSYNQDKIASPHFHTWMENGLTKTCCLTPIWIKLHCRRWKGVFLFPKGFMVLDIDGWWKGNSRWGCGLSQSSPIPLPYAEYTNHAGGTWIHLAGVQRVLWCSLPCHITVRALLAALNKSRLGELLIAA